MKKYSSLVALFVIICLAVSFATLRKRDFSLAVDFSLIDHDGNQVSELDYSGHNLLIFFGFTNCPHICPTTMTRLSEITTRLDGEVDITPVFISVDPKRDSVEVVSRYISHFHPSFVGLTGSDEQLTAAAASFKTIYLAQGEMPERNYDVVHSSAIFVVDATSHVVGYIPDNLDIEAALQTVRRTLR